MPNDKNYAACMSKDRTETVMKCPDCGMTAYKMFFNRYVCPHCKKIRLTPYGTKVGGRG